MESYEQKYKAALEWMRDVYPTLTGASKEDAEHYFPELAESKDERINEEIRNFFIDMECKREWIAYLEKQKINTEGDFARGYDCGYECCLNSHGAEWFEKQKEQKPAEWSEEDEKDTAHIIRILDDCYAYGKHDLSKTDHENLVNKLKSLRPQSKEELAKMLQDEYNKGKEAGEREGYTKGYDKGYKDANESVSYHFPVMPTTPSGFGCDGAHCTNPHMDCINCPIKTTGGMFNTASSSGNLTLKAEWKPSEEQMEALLNAEGLVRANNYPENAKILASLYEQLKKL